MNDFFKSACLLFILLGCNCVLFAETNAATLKIYPVVTMNNDSLTLADFSSAKHDSLFSEVRDLNISTLVNKQSWKISKTSIHNFLRKHLLEASIIGAEFVIVRKTKRGIAQKEMSHLAQLFLQEQLSSRYREIAIRPLFSQKDSVIYTDGLEMKARWELDDVLQKREKVWIDLLDNGAVLDSIPFWFEVYAEASVVVVIHPVSPGQLLDRSVVEVVDFDVTSVKGKLVSVDMLPMMVTQALDAGDPVSMSVLRSPRMVEVGSRIRILSRVGAVMVETHGIAQRAGDKGDEIIVIADNAFGSIRGRIIATNKVHIQEHQ